MQGLNLGSGKARYPNMIALDYAHGDVKHDLREFPYPFADAQFDFVVCNHVLEHLNYDVIKRLFAEVARMLKPGGLFRIGVPDFKRVLGEYARGWDYFRELAEEVPPRGHELFLKATLAETLSLNILFGDPDIDDRHRVLVDEEFFRVYLSPAFDDIRVCGYQQTAYADRIVIAADNRPRHTLFVEATRRG